LDVQAVEDLGGAAVVEADVGQCLHFERPIGVGAAEVSLFIFLIPTARMSAKRGFLTSGFM
jgi:hypothetical protein